MLALRRLMQGDAKHPKAPLGNNFRPPQPLHHRPVRTNIDFNVKHPADVSATPDNIQITVRRRLNPLIERMYLTKRFTQKVASHLIVVVVISCCTAAVWRTILCVRMLITA